MKKLSEGIHRGLNVLIIGTLYFIIGILVMSADRKPEVVPYSGTTHKNVVSDGNYYTVTASPHYRWKRTHKAGFLVLGYLCILAAAVYVWYVDDYVKKGTVFVIIVAAIGAMLFIIVPTTSHYYGPNGFEKTITEQQYNQVKLNPDQIFDTLSTWKH